MHLFLLSRVGGDPLFEIALRAKPVEIPINGRHGEHPATEPIGYGAIPFLRRTYRFSIDLVLTNTRAVGEG
jgi:hypothetical protein